MEGEEAPAPGDGEVLVRVTGCGLCGSDLPVWQGRRWFRYPAAPGAPGHEAWGTVLETGGGVAEVVAGDRVTGLLENAYASHATAPADHLAPIPDGIGTAPVLGEPLGCAVNVVRRARIGDATEVGIVGAGFLGTLVLVLCVAAGVPTHVLSRRVSALERAEKLGATSVTALDDGQDPVARIETLTGGRLCDVVVEATGHQEPLDLAARLTRERGRLVIAGYHQDGPRTVDMQLWNWRGLDVINAHERDLDVRLEAVREGLALLEDRVVDLAPLVTHTLPLERLQEAFVLQEERPPDFLKAVVVP